MSDQMIANVSTSAANSGARATAAVAGMISKLGMVRAQDVGDKINGDMLTNMNAAIASAYKTASPNALLKSKNDVMKPGNEAMLGKVDNGVKTIVGIP